MPHWHHAPLTVCDDVKQPWLSGTTINIGCTRRRTGHGSMSPNSQRLSTVWGRKTLRKSAIVGGDVTYPRQAPTNPQRYAVRQPPMLRGRCMPRTLPKTIKVSTFVGKDVKYLRQVQAHPERELQRTSRITIYSRGIPRYRRQGLST